MSNYHLKFAWFVGLILLIPVPAPSHAGYSLGFTMDKLSAAGWVMDDVKVDLDLNSAQQFIIQLTAAKFSHDALPGAIEGIRLDCPVQLIRKSYRCSNGSLHFNDSPYGAQDLEVSGEFVDSEQIRLTTQGVKLAGGKISVDLELKAGSWKIALKGNGLKLDPLRRQFAATFLPEETALSGIATITAQIEGSRSTPSLVDMTLRVDKFAYADIEGLHVAEDGAITLHLNAIRKGSEWRGDARLFMRHGQFYLDPYYIEVANEPLSARLEGRWTPGTDLLRIDKGAASIPRVLDTWGRLQVSLPTAEIVEADIGLSSEHVGALYGMFLQPMLIGSMGDDLAAEGALQTRIGVKDGKLRSLLLTLDEVTLDDRRGLFALYGLNGRLVWRGEEHKDSSIMTIQGGQLYSIDFGPLAIHAHVQQGEIRLDEPVELPMMQGSLLVDQFHAHGLLAETPRWSTKAQFKDISLKALAEAFEWPEMEGRLHGEIPSVHYQQKRLELDGELVVDVFGGRVRVAGLLIEEPLGRVPELFADLRLEALDLGQITKTFSFGHIQGGLEGEVSGLHLASWEPIAFDARFKTPDRDRATHRISQRAVDNLTALGSGVGSGLSTTFLGIFKEFQYDRIELQAKLDGSIAELDGMAHPSGGYYIVKGSGLPRIDVIARNRQVAWKTLLERLKRIRVE